MSIPARGVRLWSVKRARSFRFHLTDISCPTSAGTAIIESDAVLRPPEVTFMRLLRRSISSAFVACAALLVPGSGAVHANVRADGPASLTGAWILNKDLSDSPRNQTGDGGEDAARGRRSGGGRGGGRAGFGGGARRGGGRSGSDPEQAVRVRSAMRDLMMPSDRLTIVQTDSMIIITGADGRTTRLSPDGKKVKDESTKFEWKTRWDGARLVSEISGLPSGRLLETYSVDSDHRQLHLTLQVEDTRRPVTINRVYDFDTR